MIIERLHKLNRTILFVIIAALSSIVIYPQWVQTNGPYGGKVFSLAIKDNYVFAGTTRGVFVSTNDGTSWAPANNGLPITVGSVNALEINGENIYAGIGGGGVYLSTNNGESWSGINNGLPSTVYALATDGVKIFAGIYGNGVYLSTDNGSSWTEVNNGLSNKYINALAISGDNVFAGADLGGAPSGVFLTTDNGSNWSKVNNGLTDTAVSVIAISGVYVIAGTSSGTFRSANNGANWSEITNGLPESTFVRSMTVSGDKIFVGTDKDGVFISTDYGSNWVSASDGLPGSNIWTIAINGTSMLAGTNGNGIYLSTDGGSHWNESNSGLINTSVDAMVMSGNNLLAAAGIEGIYNTSNDGTSWSHSDNGIPETYIYSLAESGGNIFAGTRATGVYVSSDSGKIWTNANNGLTLWNTENIISLTGSGDYIIAGSWEGRVYLSNNSDINWSCIGDFGTARSINATCMRGNKIFAAIGQGNGSGGVWLTTDLGINWTEQNNGLFSLNDVWDIAMSESNILIHVTGNVPGEDGVFRSSDNGTTWIRVNYDGVPITGNGPFAVSANKVFFGTSYYSTDSGITWNIISNNGLPVSPVSTIAIGDGKIFAGTDGEGVWSCLQSEILPVELSSFSAAVKQNSIVLSWNTATEINNHGFEVERAQHSNNSNVFNWETLGFINGSGNSNATKQYTFTDKTIKGNGEFIYRLKQIDNDGQIKYSKEIEISVNFITLVFSLENNFPNPFNPSTVIKYTLPYESNVKLIIYNTLGKKVKELISEVQQAGLHEYNFNAEGLSSGVYLYTIQAISVDGRENYQSTKKMILMK